MGTVENGAPPEPRLSNDTSSSGVEPGVDAGREGGAASDPMLGRTVAGRFVVNARLGSGSMGTVYRATQWPIGREVAVKILRTDRGVDDASRARFLREARANSALTSPNTVTVFDFGQGEDGEFYLAMELLEGESVGERVRRLGRLPAAEAVDVTRQALTSLVEAHDKGIIHRDLKPDNLFFARIPAVDPQSQGRQGEIVKVLDFGVAKMLRDDTDMAMNAVETQAGTVFGTPRYMSPEQAQGKTLDPRTDLYSLGVILYHMLTGQPPFTDDDAIVVMARHIKSKATPPREAAPDADIPQVVDDLVMRALAKEPDGRPDSAETMLAELEGAALTLPAAPAPVRISFRPAPMPPPRTDETWMGKRVERASRTPLLTLGVAAALVGGLGFAAVLLVRRIIGLQRRADPRPGRDVDRGCDGRSRHRFAPDHGLYDGGPGSARRHDPNARPVEPPVGHTFTPAHVAHGCARARVTTCLRRFETGEEKAGWLRLPRVRFSRTRG